SPIAESQVLGDKSLSFKELERVPFHLTCSMSPSRFAASGTNGAKEYMAGNACHWREEDRLRSGHSPMVGERGPTGHAVPAVRWMCRGLPQPEAWRHPPRRGDGPGGLRFLRPAAQRVTVAVCPVHELLGEMPLRSGP